MIEVNVSLFKRLFIAFGITHGLDVFAQKEFDTALIFRVQAFTMCVYVYLDSVDGLNRRAIESTNKKLEAFNKGFLAGKVEGAATSPVVGRA